MDDYLGDDDDDDGLDGGDDDVNKEPWQGPTVTMDFDNIPLGQAVKYICEQATLRYKIEQHVVVILDPELGVGNLDSAFFLLICVFFGIKKKETLQALIIKDFLKKWE